MLFDLAPKRTSSISFLYSPRLLFEKKVLVVFTMRQGGVSAKPYDSLNLAFHVGDSRENVTANRELLLSYFGLSADRLTSACQVHGNSSVIVEEELIGRGAKSYEDAIPDTDALICGAENVALALFFADCVPVVLVEPNKRCIAVVHAGWRGILKEIISNTIILLVRGFNIEPCNLLAYIGPCVEECCYEVDEHLLGRFREKFNLPLLDRRISLAKFAETQLRQEDIPAERIFSAGICTSCQNDLFFSYRREQITGRQAAVATLLGKDFEPSF